MTHHLMRYAYKPVCRYCGKGGLKYCESVYTEEPYNGNQIAVKLTTDVWDEKYK